jgi:methyl-accepting chemotaxis protein
MDPELIAFFEARFQEIAQQFAASREETARQFAASREETSQQITGLREETAQQFAAAREETSQQITGLRKEMVQQLAAAREETARRFEQVDKRFEKVEETARHTLVLVEGLRHEVQLLAESVSGMNGKIENYHSETMVKFDQARKWIDPYYRELDGRLRVLEGRADPQRGDVVVAPSD